MSIPYVHPPLSSAELTPLYLFAQFETAVIGVASVPAFADSSTVIAIAADAFCFQTGSAARGSLCTCVIGIRLRRKRMACAGIQTRLLYSQAETIRTLVRECSIHLYF